MAEVQRFQLPQGPHTMPNHNYLLRLSEEKLNSALKHLALDLGNLIHSSNQKHMK